MKIFSFMLLSTSVLVLSGCGTENSEAKIEGRWYTQAQVDMGAKVFKKNCAECHGENAEGTPTWKQTLPDGSYPSPPLNGSAHAWHHPISILKRTINNGGIPFGGKMPPFKDKLSNAEKDAAIAYFQNKWNNDIYNAWLQRGGLK